MARKKKKIEPVIEPTVQSALAYTGLVTISLVKGKTVLSSQQFHNEGTSALFKFICYSLAGDYKAAETYRPSRIQLGYNSASTPTEASSGSLTVLTNKILYAQTPTVKFEAGQPITNLHFAIPFTQLIRSDTAEIIKINQARLFTANTSSNDYLANYYFVKKDDITGKLAWDTLELDLTQDVNINIIIDWDLKIDNKGD